MGASDGVLTGGAATTAPRDVQEVPGVGPVGFAAAILAVGAGAFLTLSIRARKRVRTGTRRGREEPMVRP